MTLSTVARFLTVTVTATLFAAVAGAQAPKPAPAPAAKPATPPAKPPAAAPAKPSATKPPAATPTPSTPATPQAGTASAPGASGCLGCHTKYAKERYVHGPVAAGRCDTCHIARDGVRHPSKPKSADGDFELKAGGAAPLCYSCHEAKNTKPVIHGPVQWGQCGMCHDPHASPYPFRLKEQPISKLCFTCHPNDKTVEKEVHGPVASGACTSCHDPHQGEKQYRLVKQGPDLCYTCHGEKQAEFTPKRFGHVPARLDCSNCHDPHNSPNPFRVSRSVPELCFGCHPDKKQQIQSVSTDHQAVAIDRKCLNCHDPHFADYPKQLKDTPMRLCLTCHDRPQQATDGKALTNMKGLLEEYRDWHGPIRQQDCAACHDPHGTNNFRILRKPYPQEFYAPFKAEQYGLCFSCHEPTLVEVASTTTLTNFRNGDRNLHVVHVNRADKGRTCRACHEVHASHRPKHIREAVPFGTWEVQTNFAKYDNGGKCAPGCHAPRGYSRRETVQNPIDYATFSADAPGRAR
jgi:predicted CXXCH cytochrome family protein